MTTSRFDLTGKTALITGASSGLGAHFARVLAASGARVVLAARRADRLSALVDELKQQGHEAMAVTMDVTDADSVDAGFSAAEQAFEAAVAELGFTVDQRIRLEALGFDVLRLRLSGDLGAAAAGRLLAARFPGLVFDTNYHYQTLRSGAAE